MKYEDIKGRLRSGDLLAFSHEGWGSWHDIKVQAVRICTRSEYSHVALVWVLGDRVFAIEAVEPCVRIWPLSKLGDFYWTPLDAEWKQSTQDFALNCIGDEYLQLTAMRAFLKSVGRDNTHECAALAAAICYKDGIDLGDRQTPDAVVKAAQKLGKPTYYVENKGEN